MGAGDFPAGVGGAGFDPVTEFAAPTVQPLPGAVRWSLETRDSVYSESGTFTPTSPIDAQMTLGLGTRKGTISGAPEIGHTFAETNLATTDQAIQRDVEERARAAVPVATLLAAKDVEILSVQWSFSRWGGLTVSTQYRNLRTGKPGQVQSK